jgi:DUF4097 and DUF4098 domain-containing protein YvlB
MRPRFPVLLILLAALPQPTAAQGRIERGLAVSPEVAVRVFNLAGTVRVSAWDRDSIAITAGVSKGGGTFYFGGSAASVKMAVEPPPGVATVPGSVIEVKVPPRARVWVKTESAEILVSGLTGSVDLSTVSGRIWVEGHLRQLAAESMDGSVQVDGDHALVRLRSASGTLVLRGTAEDATLTTVSGTVAVGTHLLGRGRFESVSGGISFKSGLAPGGSFTFESHNGDIELRLSPSADAALDLTAVEGRIVNDYGKEPVRAGRNGKGQTLSLFRGQGAADVVARTFKGTITVQAQTIP